MIHYHGLPITPNTCASIALSAGHAFVSFPNPEQLTIAAEVCQSFAIDNGAFGAWRKGEPITDWSKYYDWAARCKLIPSCDFAVIPDVIDGNETDNDALIAEWSLPNWFGAPVWHMHESFDRLERLCSDFPRICLGSSGEYAVIGTNAWWHRISQALRVICNDDGQPLVKLHGLRMLNPEIFTKIPFASADSTNIGRNIGIDKSWKGNYMPPSKEVRTQVMRARIESHNAPISWSMNIPEQCDLLTM